MAKEKKQVEVKEAPKTTEAEVVEVKEAPKAKADKKLFYVEGYGNVMAKDQAEAEKVAAEKAEALRRP